MLLGDLGADVLKVERTRVGEEARLMEPKLEGESYYVLVFNRNKRGLALDFRNPRAQELLRELVSKADVLLENFRPGTMEKMGCGWDDLRALNPRLIMARVSGFGQDGPDADRVCFDAIAQATSGLMDMTGDRSGPPTLAGTYIVDYSTALYTTIGILAALEHRNRTGEGQLVDVALLDSAVSLLITAVAEYAATQTVTSRVGNEDRYAAPGNTFQAQDGAWVHLIAGSDSHFPRILTAMGREDLVADPRFATVDLRMANRAPIEEIVAGWIGSLPADAVVAALAEVGVPCARVATIRDVLANRQLRFREQITEIEHPSVGAFSMQGLTVNLSGSPMTIRRPPPRLGEHCDEVLGEWLGYSAEQIAGLRRDRVV
jgi:crotonobetainyl-CoA:carnitine CoA-transferase CaiB-like acyl-CoA transferase